ncbi:MAG: Single cache domain 3 [Firmicutes bacterium]|nr:Single cache domain 3 [Bacillota bacterium]
MHFSIKTWFTVFFIVSAIVVSGVLGIMTIRDMHTQIEAAIAEKTKSDLATAQEIADYMHPGQWHVVNGKLYKGNFLINDNTELVDRIGRLTDDTVTIFLNNTRVATNIIRDGNRATGTFAADYVTETVLIGGKIYIGEAEVVGVNYQTGYAPIKDDYGNIIGMFYIGVSKKLADQLKQSFIAVAILSARIALLFALAATCFIPVDRWATVSSRYWPGNPKQ